MKKNSETKRKIQVVIHLLHSQITSLHDPIPGHLNQLQKKQQHTGQMHVEELLHLHTGYMSARLLCPGKLLLDEEPYSNSIINLDNNEI